MLSLLLFCIFAPCVTLQTQVFSARNKSIHKQSVLALILSQQLDPQAECSLVTLCSLAQGFYNCIYSYLQTDILLNIC